MTDSGTVPHVSVVAVAQDGYDFYSFTLTTAATVTFDIDNGMPDVDSWLDLYDADHIFIDQADDSAFIDAGSTDGGPNAGFDTYWPAVYLLPGTYYLAVGQAFEGEGIPLSAGQDYTLNISTTGAGEGTNVLAAIGITAISDDSGTPGDFVTNDTKLSVSGTHDPLSAGQTIQISNDGGATWHTATQSTTTTWSYVDPTAHKTSFGYQARIVSSSSVVESNIASQGITIDTKAPNPPTITSIVDDVLQATGNVVKGGSTNDQMLQLNGVGEAKTTISVYDGATLLAANVVVAATASGALRPTLSLTAHISLLRRMSIRPEISAKRRPRSMSRSTRKHP